MKVGIGLDEAGINDDRDMLQEMRMVLRVHRVPGMDETRCRPCPQVLRMATEHGAATTPFAKQIGKLEPGRAADLVLLRWRTSRIPISTVTRPRSTRSCTGRSRARSTRCS